MGYQRYHYVPGVILRNIMENPGWYTASTHPYQAEIAQGRLEALLNYQTMVMDLTGMEIANASLTGRGDGGGRGDAPSRVRARRKGKANTFFVVSESCHPQTIDVVKTRAWPLGHRCVVDRRPCDRRVCPPRKCLRRPPAVSGDGRSGGSTIRRLHVERFTMGSGRIRRRRQPISWRWRC